MFSTSGWNALLSVIAYSVFSNSMILSNKTLVTTFDFDYNFTILLVQSVCSVALLWIARLAGWIEFRDIDSERLKAWIPVNIFFVSMLYTSFQGLNYLSVPMVTIFKNITNVGITYGAWWLFGEKVTGATIFALCIVLVGAFLSAYYDLEFSQAGYAWMLANCTSTAGFVLYMRAAVDFPMTSWDKAYYNNLLTIPLTLVLGFVVGELPEALSAPQWGSLAFVLSAIFSGCVGVFLSLASLWCVSATDATTYAMTGALNKIPVAVISIVIFGTPVTFQSATFIAFGLLGGIIYAYVKATEKKDDKPPEKTPTTPKTAEGVFAEDEESDETDENKPRTRHHQLV